MGQISSRVDGLDNAGSFEDTEYIVNQFVYA